MSQTADSDRQKRFKELEFAKRDTQCNRIIDFIKKNIPLTLLYLVAEEF